MLWNPEPPELSVGPEEEIFCCSREKYWITLENSCADCLCWQPVSLWLRKRVRKYGNAWSLPLVALVPRSSQNTWWVYSPSEFPCHLWPLSTYYRVTTTISSYCHHLYWEKTYPDPFTPHCSELAPCSPYSLKRQASLIRPAVRQPDKTSVPACCWTPHPAHPFLLWSEFIREDHFITELVGLQHCHWEQQQQTCIWRLYSAVAVFIPLLPVLRNSTSFRKFTCRSFSFLRLK